MIVPNDAHLPGLPPGVPVGIWGGAEAGGGSDAAWRLIALGDIGLSGCVGQQARAVGGLNCFRQLAPVLKAADCVFANLETPLLASWTPKMLFGGDSRWAEALGRAGIQCLHLASNHMLDHGADGFRETIHATRSAGLVTLGVGESDEEASGLVTTDFNGRRVGWLAAGHTGLRQPSAPRLWELESGRFLRAVEEARSQVELLITSLHWGPMLVDYPYLEQHALAHRLVDAGASAVLMHHAHVLQGIEVLHGVPICYGLGNCLFDPDEGLLQQAKGFRHIKYQEQLSGAVFSLEWCGDTFSRVVVAPFRLPSMGSGDSSWELDWPDAIVAQDILRRLVRISDDLAGDFTSKLEEQLWAVRRWGIQLNLNLLLRRGEVWRAWYLLKTLRLRHLRSLWRRLVG